MVIVAPKSKPGLVQKSVDSLKPSSANDTIYRPPDPRDPDLRALATSIRDRGLLDPIVITLDDQIVSGHRRHAACKLANVTTVPCRVLMIDSRIDPDAFVTLLCEYNRQRVKTADESLREEIISANPAESHRRLTEHREKASKLLVEEIKLDGAMERSSISKMKQPMLNKAIEILEGWKHSGHLPCSVRRIHYAMLNDPPMFNKRRQYTNDEACYKGLSSLLTQAREAGIIRGHYIEDETRVTELWNAHRSTGPYIREKVGKFLKGYYRDLMQSQPNHIEIVAEKLTVRSLVSSVASDYTMPMTISRGYPSWPPRQKISNRYLRSGKEQLILIFVTDFDPDGEEIVQAFGKSMRDDFGIDDIVIAKACLNLRQVEEYELPVSMEAKKKSANYDRFVSRYDTTNAHELESMPPELLQKLLRESIDRVIDVDAFNGEVDREAEDAAYLDAVRAHFHNTLASVGLGDDGATSSD